MELLNYTEKWVMETLDEVLSERNNICRCKICRLDMACMALNRLKPNYAVSKHGNVYARSKMLEQQIRTDILAEVIKAVNQVSANPHHLP